MRTKTRYIIAGLIIVIAVIVWTSWLAAYHQSATSQRTVTSTPPTVAVIEITPSGFLPRTIAVNTNTEVIWVNEDAMPHKPAADPYPTHRNLPSLVAPSPLGQKETYSFLFTRQGVVAYHDDLDPTLTGTVEIR
ncbi:MAG TPA: hypothetical protein VGS08_00130 [Candidatus Saccharimonadales bacterium]|nr:hypothetical protein [Candidatus Saccharimonadales bacterium]